WYIERLKAHRDATDSRGSESAMRYRRSNLPTEDAAPVAGAQPAARSTFRVPGRGTHPRSVARHEPTGVPTASADPDLLTGLVDVVAITEVTHDVKTFELRAAWMTCVDFEPGQYVTMRVPELGLERCYSISSAPFGTNTFTITVKRVAGGPVSNHLHDAVAVGDRLHADGPYGLFST